jgi:hypothetical protein
MPLRQLPQNLEHVFLPVAIEPGELEELLRSLDHRTALGTARHRHPPPPPELEQTLVAEQPESAQHRVGIDLEDGGQVLGRRESFPRAGLPRRNGAAQFRCDLVMEGECLRAIDLDTQHDAMHSSTMKTETAGAPQPAEVLIPEARQHQRTRYRRRGAAVVVVALVVVALIISAVLLVRGPAASGKAHGDPKPAPAVLSTSGVVYFRPVLCFAAPYARPAGGTSQAGQSGTEPIPACAAGSLLSAANMDVTPNNGAQGYSSNNWSPDPQYAPYPSTNVHSPGYASRTVLLPGLNGACNETTNERCVLGPAEMSSRAVAKASVTRNQTGQWVVNYTTTGAGAAVWDKVAHENFHQFLGIELNGVVYTAPLMQPAQTSFSTFDGRGELTGNFDRSQAMRLAGALNSHKG